MWLIWDFRRRIWISGRDGSETAAMSDGLLRDITEYCRRARMAESTFGRLAVNDGKLVSRLRLGGHVRGQTAERVRAFLDGATEPAPINGSPIAVPAVMPAPGQAVRTDSSAVNQPTITQYGIVGSPAKPLFRRLVRDFADGRFWPRPCENRVGGAQLGL